jgi:hypothetical protein
MAIATQQPTNSAEPPLLFWRTIREAQENGLEELDMGRSNTDNPGLIAFKEHWGATGSLLNYWTYPKKPARHPSNWQKSLARRVVSAAPDLGLGMVGTLSVWTYRLEGQRVN